MIIDTSAVIAIALQEPGWEALYEQAIPAVSFANAVPLPNLHCLCCNV